MTREGETCRGDRIFFLIFGNIFNIADSCIPRLISGFNVFVAEIRPLIILFNKICLCFHVTEITLCCPHLSVLVQPDTEL